jgi:hypothetical protein
MRVAMVGAMLALWGTAATVQPVSAQEPINVAVQVPELWRIFKDLYGPGGLVVNSLTPLPSGVTHSAHFNSGFESEFSQFGTAMTGQIVSLPLPPPASGFTYQFDPALGVFSRTTTSFGPILSERAETIGINSCHSTQLKASISMPYPRCSRTTMPIFWAGGRTSSRRRTT